VSPNAHVVLASLGVTEKTNVTFEVEAVDPLVGPLLMMIIGAVVLTVGVELAAVLEVDVALEVDAFASKINCNCDAA
jgi:hypothetical protein